MINIAICDDDYKICNQLEKIIIKFKIEKN